MLKNNIKTDTSESSTALAYSYIRFSSVQQREGDSLRRQTELTETYCRRRGWTLDRNLSTQDLGMSAAKGKNALVGNLRTFLDAVKSGKAVPGSALIVESIDRISRQGIDEGYDLIKSILKSGIRIVTLTPEREFGADAIKKLSQGALEIQLILERAAEESERKSERVGAAKAQARKAARETGKTMTKQLPLWVRETPTGERELIPERAKVIRDIFKLAVGGFGVIAIVKKLNRDKVEPFTGAGHSGASWTRSYIDLILRDKRALGEFQPRKGRQPDGEPIKDYFPAVVSEKQFYAARSARKTVKQFDEHRRFATRVGKHTHLFAMPLCDARSLQSGGRYVAKTMRKRKTNDSLNRVLVTSNEFQGAKQMSFPLAVFERAMLRHLREIEPREIVRADANDAPDELIALATELAGIEAELADARAYLAQKFNASAADAAGRLEDRQRETAARLADARAKAASPVAESWVEFRTLAEALEKSKDPNDTRIRIRSALRRVVDRLILHVVPCGRERTCFVEVNFNNDYRRTYQIWYRSASNGRDSRWWSSSWLGYQDHVHGDDDERERDRRWRREHTGDDLGDTNLTNPLYVEFLEEHYSEAPSGEAMKQILADSEPV